MSRRLFPPPAQQHLLKTVRLELARPDEIGRHHCLHNATLVGEVLRYVARDETGAWLACPNLAGRLLKLGGRRPAAWPGRAVTLLALATALPPQNFVAGLAAPRRFYRRTQALRADASACVE